MSATISKCGLYRYTLKRVVDDDLRFQRWTKKIIFVMLNPSTADASKDDPTIRRCFRFAEREGATELIVVNLYALRATDPEELYEAKDPTGPDNVKHVFETLKSEFTDKVIVAWGAHPLATRSKVYKLLQGMEMYSLGVTKSGAPRHPLYVKGDTPLVRWRHP